MTVLEHGGMPAVWRRSIAEALVKNAAGCIPAGDPDRGLTAAEDEAATNALDGPVVADTSALLGAIRTGIDPHVLTSSFSQVFGGTATLVGDPPNIMISSKAELGYLDFLSVLGPIAALIMAVFLGTMWFLFGRNMTVAPHLREAVMALNPKDAVRDHGLLRRCLWALGGVNLGFAFHSFVHLEPATVALLGASAFMLLGHARGRSNETEEMKYLAEVEWKTIFFFIGLFILVGGLVKIGAIALTSCAKFAIRTTWQWRMKPLR